VTAHLDLRVQLSSFLSKNGLAEVPKKQSHFRDLVKDFVVYGFMSALSQMGGLLLLPLLTRILSMEEYGVVDIIATFVALVSVLMKLALPNGLVRYFVEYTDQKRRAQYVSALLCVTVLSGVFLLAVISVFSTQLAKMLSGNADSAVLLLLGGGIALIMSARGIPQTVLRMERRIVAFNVGNMVSVCLYVMLTILLAVVLKSGVIGVFYAQICAELIAFVLTLWLARGHLTWHVSFTGVARTLRFSLPMLPSLLSTWINRQTDRIMLLWLVGLSGVATYAAAAKIGMVISFLLNVFWQSWQPYSMLILKNNRRDELYRRMFNYYAGGFAVVSLFFVAAGPEMFRMLMPAEYHRGYFVLPWFIGALVLHYSGAFTPIGMLVSEKTAMISIASWIGVLFNILLGLCLIYLCGVQGAAIGMFIAELTRTSILWWFSRKTLPIAFDMRIVVSILIAYTLCSLFLVITPVMLRDATYSCAVRITALGITIVYIMRVTMDEFMVRRAKQAAQRLANAIAVWR
jgi:O-antigen/teichoic acid export membrane protein